MYMYNNLMFDMKNFREPTEGRLLEGFLRVGFLGKQTSWANKRKKFSARTTKMQNSWNLTCDDENYLQESNLAASPQGRDAPE